MDISALGRTIASFTSSSNHRKAPDTEPAPSVLGRQAEQTASGQPRPVELLERPAPVERVTRIEPASENPRWDWLVEQTLQSMPAASSWSALSRGLGELSHQSEFTQWAETQLRPRTEAVRELDDRHTSALGNLRFSATLKGGTEVTFEVKAEAGHGRSGSGSVAFRNLEVTYSANEELTEEQRAELDAFSKKLGSFAGDFASDGEPDLSRLNLDELETIQSLDLRMKVNEERTLTLRYSRDIESGSQALQLKWNERSLELMIDNASNTGTSQAEDLSLLRTALIENLEKAKAEKGDKQVILQALTLFGLDDSSTEQPNGSDALLTGLPDYHLSFSGEITRPMKHTEHHNKFSGIQELTLSQTTKTTERNGQLTIEQTRTSYLDAAYFTSLPHLENPDYGRENFKWHTLNESHQLSSEQTWRGASLEAANLTRASLINNMVETWSEGQKVDEQLNNRRSHSEDDVTALLRMINRGDAFEREIADRKLGELQNWPL